MTEIELRIAEANRRLGVQGMRLFPYQEDGAEWLAARPTALLSDEPGLGKTYQAVVAAPPRAPVLVVCPSAVKFTWAKSFRSIRPEFPHRIIDAKADWRFPRPGEIVVCGYEILPPAQLEIDRAAVNVADKSGVKIQPPPWSDAMRDAYMKALTAAGAARACPGEWSKLTRMIHARRRVTVPFPGTVVIADEAHRVKNNEAAVTVRFREVSALVRGAPGGRVWLLTGTPMMNRTDELWTVLQAAGLGTIAFAPHVGASAKEARGRFDIDALFPGKIPEKLRTVMLRRLRSDVLPELPEKTHEVVEVKLDPDTENLADDLVLRLRAAGVNIQTATLDVITTAVMKTIPREMMSELRSKLAQAKIPALLDLVEDIEDANVPLVVFSDHRSALDLLAKRDGWTKITGEETATQKSEAEAAFQAGQFRGIAVSIRAGGVGITLTHAWRAIFVDLPWVPALLSQAEDRLCRIGQKSQGLLYTRLVAAHVLERKIQELLETKERLFAKTIDAAATPGRRE